MHQHRTSSWIYSCLLALGAACNPAEDGPGSSGDTIGTTADATSSSEPGTSTTDGTTSETTATSDSSSGGSTGALTSSGTETETSTGTSSGTDAGTSTTGGEPATFCSRLGGAEGSAVLAKAVRERVLADDRINAYFLNADLDDTHLWSCIGDLIATMAGCEDAVYTCADMATAHAGLGISALDFGDFAEDFAKAFEAAPAETTPEDRATLLAALTAMSQDIVADPENSATLYQRVGRKPAIAGLIGAPNKGGTLLGRVATNAAINGFFAAADFARLGTCLTRQFAAIDGPAHYGLEVDAPGGVDPGVGSENPCRDMATAHAGLADGDMEGITFADFGLLMTDLQHTLEAFAVAPADHAALLAALEPLCVDIVAGPEKPACPGFYQTDVLAAPGVYAFIPDDAYDGTLDSMRCHAFEVADDDIDVVTGAELAIGVAHPFIGDLVIKVQNPALDVLTVLNRPGFAELTDSGTGGPGDDSALLGVVPIRFADEAPFVAELMGGDLPAKHAVCNDDPQCDFRPSPGMGPGSNFAGFKGSKAAGTWKVCVGDAGEDHVGNVNSIVLTIQQQKYWP
jgi:truncated hemoglobin YjbI